ncbi:glycosyltransferase family 4 protein [Sulfobacillus sp. hq2]|uniref:glycosyltransferase family 4 protein n=1 Tax=Sulfobacillus sp. hq2 TaxID=2039167 RepID=UPI000CD2E30D|nr:glycosyltransferase family 4 protein [Sulfobacillus sp. hq2]POB10334.1 hypothetical protein CO251_10300 [Sulfobacillus sp. hq2]
MNILIASRELQGVTASGGIGVYVRQWAQDLAQAGHEVRILSKGLASQGTMIDSVAVDFVQADPRFRDEAMGYAFALYEKILALTSSQPWDLIEFPDYLAEGYFTIKAKRLLGQFARTTLRVHGHMSLELCDRINQEIPRSDRQRIYALERYAMQYCDVLTAPSVGLAEIYEDQFKRNVLVTRHPLPNWQPLAGKRERKGPATLVYVGRLEYRKGIDLLLRACLPLWESQMDFRLQLIGQDTHYRGQSFQRYLLSSLPSEFWDRVEFVGTVNREALRDYYAQAHAVVFPSRFENWPNVCLEAMRMGVPIIGSKWGGMREMLEEGAGILINPEHQPSFSVAIAQVLTDSELANTLAEAAQARVVALQADPDAVLAKIVKELPPTRKGGIPPYPQRLSVIIEPQSDHGEPEMVKSLAAKAFVEEIMVAQWPKALSLPDHVVWREEARDPWSAAENALGDFVVVIGNGEQWAWDFLEQAVKTLACVPELSAVYGWVETDAGILEVPEDLDLTRVLVPSQAWARGVVRKKVLAAPAEDAPAGVLPQWDMLISLAMQGLKAELLPTTSVRGLRVDDDKIGLMWEQHAELLGQSGLATLIAVKDPSQPYGLLRPAWLRGMARLAPPRLVRWVKQWRKEEGGRG